MLAATDLWWITNFSEWSVCVCVWVCHFMDYSSIFIPDLYSCFQPTWNVTTPWIKLCFSLCDSSSLGKQTQAMKNAIDDVRTLVGFIFGSGVSGQGSQFIMVCFIIPPSRHFTGVLHNFMYIVMLWGKRILSCFDLTILTALGSTNKKELKPSFCEKNWMGWLICFFCDVNNLWAFLVKPP